MIINYLTTAFRNLKRHKRHALLNIIGLAVAIAACIVIFLVIRYEYSYDTHHTNRNNIFQVVTKDIDADGEHYTSGVPFPATKFLRQDFPQVTFAEIMQSFGSQVTALDENGKLNGKKFIEQTGVFYAEPELFSIFDGKWLSGNASVLKDISSVAISKSIADKYFGSWKEAVGKKLKLDNEDFNYQVAAVFEDVPKNSDFPFQLMFSYGGFVAHNGNGWPLEDWGSNTSNHQVYALLPPGMKTHLVDKGLALFEKKYNTENKQTTRTHFLQPLKNIHFDERLGNNGDHITNKASLYTLAFIGLLIILMACINFVNLSTALVVTRSKEVGVRKVMGSSKAQLRWQVIAETFLLVIIATAIAILLAGLALPYVKHIFVVQVELSLLTPVSILFITGITVATVVLSGLYPAFVLSRLKPIEAIKNKINSAKVGGISLRRGLVVLQFAFSQILIIATIVAVSQMSFIRKTDLGFNKDAVLILSGNADSASLSRLPAFRNELLAINDVKSVSFSSDIPSSTNSWESNFAVEKNKDFDFNVQLKFADEEYFETYGLELLAGRVYGPGDTAREYVVNETLVKKTGLKSPQEAIGKMLRLGGGRWKPIAGVVKDFKQSSLRSAVVPVLISPKQKYYRNTSIKLNSTNLARSNEQVERVWNKYFPEYVYSATFFDESINRFYEQEHRLSLMYKVYAALAIFISCLGLYGLISFIALQKTKEVGIRKVLGAGTGNIVYLFSKEFTILIGIAFVLAAPVAWYLMNSWLKDFAYRISIGAGVFILAVIISLTIAWITVGYKAVKAALANPVKSLRTE